MGSKGNHSCLIQLLTALSFVISCSKVICVDNSTGESLDILLQHSAFDTLTKLRPHTGALYKARTSSMPGHLPGIQVLVVRLRSRKFWIRGANFSTFNIPPGTMPVPYVRRIAIVYQDLGNWSSHFYGMPGYKLLTSVMGFSIYDSSNLSSNQIKKVSLNTTGKLISIRFANMKGTDRIEQRKCAAFDSNGQIHLSDMSSQNVCYGSDQGHFSIVVAEVTKHKSRAWRRIVFLIGFSGLVVVGMGIAGIVIFRAFCNREEVNEMEMQTEEERSLDMMWIGGSKMPSAKVTRTQPVLESAHVP